MSAQHDFLAAPVPRNLRVRASLQVANTRLPARSFVLLMAILLVSGIAIARGADLVGTVQIAGAGAALGMTLLEGRWWGYSTAALASLLLTHLMRPGTLELTPKSVALPPEHGLAQALHAPHWQQKCDQPERLDRLGSMP